MAIILDLNKFSAPSIREIKDLPKQIIKQVPNGRWDIVSELLPSDMYCYLHAKFGPPNGIQNFLRNDDSDNLIHWDWTLLHTRGLLMILGMNFRTEIMFKGRWDFGELSKTQLLGYMKKDMVNYGREMKRIRKEVLEDWEIILNPFFHTYSTILRICKKLEALSIDPKRDLPCNPKGSIQLKQFAERIRSLSEKYTDAYDLSISLGCLVPVLAETFLNLLLYVLMKDEIKENARLRESVIREQMDVKVGKLHLHCIGFSKNVDFNSEACKNYSKVVNKRNDVLHGNIVKKKLKIGEVYFNGKVPVYKNYIPFGERLFATSIKASGYSEVSNDLEAVHEFIEYVLSCLEKEIRVSIEIIMKTKEIGINKNTGKFARLFPEHIADMQYDAIISV